MTACAKPDPKTKMTQNMDVPSTTALRWINSMTREGLIVRRPCQRDGRRSFLAIAPDTYQAMLAMAADSLRTEQRVRARYQRAA